MLEIEFFDFCRLEELIDLLFGLVEDLRRHGLEEDAFIADQEIHIVVHSFLEVCRWRAKLLLKNSRWPMAASYQLSGRIFLYGNLSTTRCISIIIQSSVSRMRQLLDAGPPHSISSSGLSSRHSTVWFSPSYGSIILQQFSFMLIWQFRPWRR